MRKENFFPSVGDPSAAVINPDGIRGCGGGAGSTSTKLEFGVEYTEEFELCDGDCGCGRVVGNVCVSPDGRCSRIFVLTGGGVGIEGIRGTGGTGGKGIEDFVGVDTGEERRLGGAELTERERGLGLAGTRE